MNNTTKNLVVAALAASALSLSANANNIVSGELWHVTEAQANNATLATAAGLGTPDVTFNAPAPLNFDSRLASGDYTVGGFLSTGGATSVVGSSSFLASNLDNNSGGTLIRFTGQVTVTNGETFTIAHDDGLTLVIGGLTVVNRPGPTSPTVTTDTYSGPSGTFAFTLVYGECCGAPAVLNVDLPLRNVPDSGSTVAMLGGALIVLGGVSRRLK